MEKSRRLFLLGDDWDIELIRDQMTIKEIRGGYREDAIIDPAKIIGSNPYKIAHAVIKEHEAVLKPRMEEYNSKD